MKRSMVNSIVKSSFVSIFLMVGCNKFVTVDPPINQLVTASVFNDNSSATSALTVIYAQMVGESSVLSLNSGLLADEFTNFSTGIANRLFYSNSLSPVNYTGPWQNAYSYIYESNAIIEGLQKTNGVSPAVKKQLTGESLFIRSFWYFYLVNIYGDVPLVISTDYSLNKNLRRARKDAIYAQIIDDLKSAEGLLSPNFVSADDTTLTTERVRPCSFAATALLARVYLYTRDYSNAKAEASKVIQNTNLFSLPSNLNAVFLANSSEAIWQLAIPLPSSTNTRDANQYILTAAPTNVALSPQILASFEGGDLRMSKWIGSVNTSSPSATYYFPYKYKAQGSSISEYVMVLRLAEQYLIKAEAEANLDEFGNANNDLNTIRHRAGIDSINFASKSDLLAGVLQERRVELFSEWGHRWFDLIRTGSIDTVMINQGVAGYKGATWQSNGNQTLYPIPQPEIIIDHNLSQNPGY